MVSTTKLLFQWQQFIGCLRALQSREKSRWQSVAALLGERSVVDPLERAERIAKAPDGRVDASQEKRAAGVLEEEGRVAGAPEDVTSQEK